MITGLVARPWCLMEICSKQDIINIVTDASTETTKIGICACFALHPSFEVKLILITWFIYFLLYLGMEARYKCCLAIHKAFMSSTRLTGDPALAGIASKVRYGCKYLCA